MRDYELALPIPAALLETIAERVAQLVATRLPTGPAAEESWRLVDTEQAARILTRSTRWVRDHRDEIGWVRLDGGGLAFDVDDLRRFAQERRIGGEPLARAEKPLHGAGFSRPSLRAVQKAGR